MVREEGEVAEEAGGVSRGAQSKDEEVGGS